MRKSLLFCSLLLVYASLSAQDKIPSFGKIEKADLELKDCAFDPGAPAMVMFEVCDVYYYFGSNTIQIETEYRIRVKVLKESGIDKADIKIRYPSKRRYDDIHNIHGQSYNLDESGNIVTTKLEKSQVYDKQIDEYYSAISFAVPNVKIGTVFEYKYKKTRKSLDNISPWYFQHEIPVAYSEYKLRIPDGFKFAYQAIKRQNMEVVEGKHANDGNTYIMRNIPGLKEETFADNAGDYFQRLEFTLSGIQIAGQPYFDIMGTWPKSINKLLEDEDFGLQLKKNVKNTPELDASLTKANSTREKIRTIYNYVQRNMVWNGVEDIYSANGVKNAWDKKTGSVADINLLLINMLRDNGITAKPMLASSKENGTVNTYYPDMSQFNQVLAMAVDGEDVYVMNACSKNTPFHLIPADVLNTDALIIDRENTGWVTLSINKKLSHFVLVTANVESSGTFTGTGSISSQDYGRIKRIETYKRGKLTEMLSINPGGIKIEVDSLVVSKEEDETESLNQNFRIKGSLEKSGEYAFLPFNLFTTLNENPFLDENRIMDIDFYYPQQYLVSGNYFIPEEFEVEELPKNLRMIMPDSSISVTRMVQHTNNVVQFRLSVSINVYGYTVADYPDVREYFKKLYELLEERVVLRRKK